LLRGLPLRAEAGNERADEDFHRTDLVGDGHNANGKDSAEIEKSSHSWHRLSNLSNSESINSMSTFVAATSLHACYLDDQAPPGLMRFDNPEGEWLFWIVRDENQVVAVQLTAQGGRRWRSSRLTEDGTWLGLHLGPVEVEVDSAVVELHESSRGEVGRIYVRGGALHLRAAGQQYNDRVSLEIGEAAGGTDNTSAAAFPSWRLIQRRGQEIAVLYTSPVE